MNKATPKEVNEFAAKHGAKISEYSQSLLLITVNQLAAIIDEIRATQPPQDERCPVCGEDEPFTGTCGAGDKTNALCKRPAKPAPPVALSTLTDERIYALRNIALETFDGPETAQTVRDVIEWYHGALLAAPASAPAQQATPPQPVAAQAMTEDALAAAVREWFPDRSNQADYFAAAMFGHPKNAHQEHIAAMAGTGSDESAEEAV